MTTAITADQILAKVNSGQTTVHDLVMNHGKPKRRYEYASLTARMQKLLAEGGDYHSLLGKHVFPSDFKRGPKSPKWCAGVAAIKDQTDRPVWANSTDIVAMDTQLSSHGIVLNDRDRKAIASLGKTAYLAVIGLQTSLTAVADEERTLRRAAEAELKAYQAKTEKSLLALVDQRLAERGAATAPTAQ